MLAGRVYEQKLSGVLKLGASLRLSESIIPAYSAAEGQCLNSLGLKPQVCRRVNPTPEAVADETAVSVRFSAAAVRPASGSEILIGSYSPGSPE